MRIDDVGRFSCGRITNKLPIYRDFYDVFPLKVMRELLWFDKILI